MLAPPSRGEKQMEALPADRSSIAGGRRVSAGYFWCQGKKIATFVSGVAISRPSKLPNPGGGASLEGYGRSTWTLTCYRNEGSRGGASAAATY